MTPLLLMIKGQWRVDFLIDRNRNITETRTDNNQIYRLIKRSIDKPTLNITSTSIFKHQTENPYLKVGDDADVSVIGINNSSSTLSNTVNLSFEHTPQEEPRQQLHSQQEHLSPLLKVINQ